MQIFRILCLMCFLIIATGAVRADQKDPRLGGLFASLKDASSARAAAAIERDIWGIWLEHPDAEVAKLMREGTKAMSITGNFIQALKIFDDVIEKAPEFAEGWNKRATLHYLMENYDLSLHDIDETLALEPRHFGALYGRGLVYLKLEEPDSALEAFEETLTVSPQMPSARNNVKQLRQILKKGEDI